MRGPGWTIEEGRSCIDVVRRVDAVTDGLHEASLPVPAANLRIAVAEAVEGGDGEAAVRGTPEDLRGAPRP